MGKTIIFAKNQPHADFIAERFNANYPHYKGEFARVITFKTEYAQSLIDNFANNEKAPHIAISVDTRVSTCRSRRWMEVSEQWSRQGTAPGLCLNRVYKLEITNVTSSRSG